MNDMDIKNEVINIDEVSSTYTYTQLCFLIDQDDFLADIKSVRKYLNIYELIEYKDIKERIKKDKLKFYLTGKGKTELEQQIHKLLDKYKKTTGFYNLLESAILTGKITDNELNGLEPFKESAYITVLTEDSYLPLALAIIITPDTTLADLESILQSEQYKYALKSYKSGVGTIDPWSKDTIKNIKRDRQWYWLNKKPNKLGYAKIADNLKKFDSDYISAAGVEKAIKRYKQNLETESRRLINNF